MVYPQKSIVIQAVSSGLMKSDLLTVGGNYIGPVSRYDFLEVS